MKGMAAPASAAATLAASPWSSKKRLRAAVAQNGNRSTPLDDAAGLGEAEEAEAEAAEAAAAGTGTGLPMFWRTVGVASVRYCDEEALGDVKAKRTPGNSSTSLRTGTGVAVRSAVEVSKATMTCARRKPS